MQSKILNGLKLLFTPLAFAFLIYFAWSSRHELAELLHGASWSHLLVAIVIWATLHALMPVLAVVMFQAAGSDVSWRQAFSAHAARLPARYLPGGIWHTVGRVLDYRELGVPARHISAFVLVENGLAAAVTLGAGGAIVYSMRGADALGATAGLASVAGLAGLVAIFFVTNAKVLQAPDRLAPGSYANAILVVISFWIGAATAFLIYIDAFPAVASGHSLLEMAGIYLFSWGVGFVTLIAPQGIGVFEVVASELATGPLGFMGLAAFMAGFRVVVLLADVTVWLLYLATRRSD